MICYNCILLLLPICIIAETNGANTNDDNTNGTFFISLLLIVIKCPNYLIGSMIGA